MGEREGETVEDLEGGWAGGRVGGWAGVPEGDLAEGQEGEDWVEVRVGGREVVKVVKEVD